LVVVEAFSVADQHLEVRDAVNDVCSVEVEAAVMKLSLVDGEHGLQVINLAARVEDVLVKRTVPFDLAGQALVILLPDKAFDVLEYV
jgi:hypothetical protein